MINLETCNLCPIFSLLPNGCTPVPPVGPKTSSIMIIGEAPGATEVEVGMPFVGPCGRLLDRLLSSAGINRENVYITNTVKCRPTDDGRSNRPPNSAEISTCTENHLFREIYYVRPTYIFTLGKVPTYALLAGPLKKSFKMKDVVGKVFPVSLETITISVIPNYHPSYIMQYGKEFDKKAIEVFVRYNVKR